MTNYLFMFLKSAKHYLISDLLKCYQYIHSHKKKYDMTLKIMI